MPKEEKREPKNLSEVEKITYFSGKIKDGFDEGKSDEILSKELDISTQQISILRSLMGLRYHTITNVFEESRGLNKDIVNNAFIVTFRIPMGLHERLGIDIKKDYHFIASIPTKKQVTINIMEK